MPVTDDMFTVFISHKLEDHALALAVRNEIESLNPELIDCFVAEVDIAAGMDWRREIRAALARSHLLVLLFTAPSKRWDWCLYETGLYRRFDRPEARSVVSLYAPDDATPSPLADLQGVAAVPDKIRAFLDSLCRRTWEVSDDWRRGPLALEIAPDRVEAAARSIAEAFRRAGSAATHYPCHRIVLSFSESDDLAGGVPEGARVMTGPNETSDYTMSLFDLAGGTATGPGEISSGPSARPTPPGGRSSTRTSSVPSPSSSSHRWRAASAQAVRARLPSASTGRSSTASCAGPQCGPRRTTSPTLGGDRAP